MSRKGNNVFKVGPPDLKENPHAMLGPSFISLGGLWTWLSSAPETRSLGQALEEFTPKTVTDLSWLVMTLHASSHATTCDYSRRVAVHDCLANDIHLSGEIVKNWRSESPSEDSIVQRTIVACSKENPCPLCFQIVQLKIALPYKNNDNQWQSMTINDNQWHMIKDTPKNLSPLDPGIGLQGNDIPFPSATARTWCPGIKREFG